MAYSAAAVLDSGRQAPMAACGHTAGNSLTETGASAAALLSRFLEGLTALDTTACGFFIGDAANEFFLVDSKAHIQGGTRPNAVSFASAIACTDVLSESKGANTRSTSESVLCISERQCAHARAVKLSRSFFVGSC